MFKIILSDDEVPLDGLGVLLSELSTAGKNRQWRRLVQPSWLEPVLTRCWAATEPLDIRHSCWIFSNMYAYLPEEMAEISDHKELLARWIQQAPEGACYAIGHVINHVHNTDGPLGASIIALVDPRAMAQTINTAGPSYTGEISNLLSMMLAAREAGWKSSYLDHIDRNACYRKASNWPQDACLSVAADICEHFFCFDPEFGLTLIEALIPAIADRLRSDPQEAFYKLNDIVWDVLRLYDPLNIYVGKLAPSKRMRQVGRRICSCWSPQDLASKLSRSSHRNFQSAAGLLSFMKKASPRQFKATVSAFDWDEIDKAIGADWAEEIGDARMLLGVAYSVPSGQTAIRAMIERNEARIVTMSPHLAALAPASAMRHLSAGKCIALYHGGHVDWELGAFVLAKIIQTEPTLVHPFLEPHYRGLGEALSQPSPSFYSGGLLFLRILAQHELFAFERVLDEIDIENAKRGWRNAIRGRQNHSERGASPPRHAVRPLSSAARARLTFSRMSLALAVQMNGLGFSLWRMM